MALYCVINILCDSDLAVACNDFFSLYLAASYPWYVPPSSVSFQTFFRIAATVFSSGYMSNCEHFVRVRGHINACVYIYEYMSRWTQACLLICVYVCILVCVSVCMLVHMYFVRG